jgi:hypothetical protein
MMRIKHRLYQNEQTAVYENINKYSLKILLYGNDTKLCEIVHKDMFTDEAKYSSKVRYVGNSSNQLLTYLLGMATNEVLTMTGIVVEDLHWFKHFVFPASATIK